MKKLSLIISFLLTANGALFSQSCLPEGIEFTTQSQIDSFQIIYPGCTEIEGSVEIIETEITNLNGLSVLTSIVGNLDIHDNDSLVSLAGLDNLSFVGEDIDIYASGKLTDLTGLGSLTTVGKNFWFGRNDALTSVAGMENLTTIGKGLDFWRNYELVDFSGLENLTSVGTFIGIYENDALTSLTGLQNIDPNSIIDLYIFDNMNLSTCEVKSICDYLVSSTGTVEIHDNATGCNSQAEVEEACEGLSVNELIPEIILSLHPNPANEEVFISCNDRITIDEITIYNQTGQIVYHGLPSNNRVDVSALQQGMYILEVVAGQRKVREKLMVM